MLTAQQRDSHRKLVHGQGGSGAAEAAPLPGNPGEGEGCAPHHTTSLQARVFLAS